MPSPKTPAEALRLVESAIDWVGVEHLERRMEVVAALALLRRHLEPQWTREVPSLDGRYWVWSPELDEIEFVDVTNQGRHIWRGITHYVREDFTSSDGWCFMPASIPPLPAPANQESEDAG